MKITVCIGSSCHLKGSKKVVSRLQEILVEKNISDKVELAGTFCMGKCVEGVCVTVDGELHSVEPSKVDEFVEKEVLSKL